MSYVLVLLFLFETPRSGISELKGMCVFNFKSYFQIPFTGSLFWVVFLTAFPISSMISGLLEFSTSSWISFSKLCFPKKSFILHVYILHSALIIFKMIPHVRRPLLCMCLLFICLAALNITSQCFNLRISLGTYDFLYLFILGLESVNHSFLWSSHFLQCGDYSSIPP